MFGESEKCNDIIIVSLEWNFVGLSSILLFHEESMRLKSF